MVSSVWNLMNAENARSSGPAIRVLAVVGLVAAYAMSIRLKMLGYLPHTVTWAGVALLPGLMFLAVAAVAFLPTRTPRQRRFTFTVMAVSYVAGMGVVYWQGWH